MKARVKWIEEFCLMGESGRHIDGIRSGEMGNRPELSRAGPAGRVGYHSSCKKDHLRIAQETTG